MTDEQIQRKLNQLTKITNELAKEASDRYGSEGGMYFEASGTFHMMSNMDIDSGDKEIAFSNVGHCSMDCGGF